MKPFLICAAAMGMALSIGCGKGGDDNHAGHDHGDAATNAAVEPGKGAKRPPVEKLTVKVIREGKGPVVRTGDLVSVKYEGKLADGTVFDTNIKQESMGQMFTTVVGSGQVIKGWDEGFVGLKEGGTYELSIPYKLAYGEAGASGKIPPKADLFFTVTILGVVKKNEEDVVVKDDINVGKGAEAKAGSTVTFHYKGTFLDSHEFDNSYKSKRPLTVVLGKNQIIPGLDFGLRGMKVGGKRILRIPPLVAYGPGGNGVVPPNSTLVFEVDLLAVK